METLAPPTTLVTPKKYFLKSLVDCDITEQQATDAMEDILRSSGFARSPRMMRLLRYLVEMYVMEDNAALTEVRIGLEVFDRDPECYFTGDDPIVRVQTGRLREKLTAFYETEGARAVIKITLPLGSYRPVLQRSAIKRNDFMKNYLLALQPVRCINSDVAVRCFADGLGEELANRLFHEFGNQVVSPRFDAEARTAGAVSHVLEGSVRASKERMRASFRLVDAAAGCIVWSAQFDQPACLSMNGEENLARAVSDSLRTYYCQA